MAVIASPPSNWTGVRWLVGPPLGGGLIIAFVLSLCITPYKVTFPDAQPLFRDEVARALLAGSLALILAFAAVAGIFLLGRTTRNDRAAWVFVGLMGLLCGLNLLHAIWLGAMLLSV